MLQEYIDALLLSVGQDEHVASLFPYSNALNEKSRTVVPVVDLKPPPESLTITPCVIQSAESTFLFEQRREQWLILAKAIEDSNDISKLPVRLVIDSTWVLDSDVGDQLNSALKM